ncbi:spore gernimation protein [Virgibacillus indicus]|uniref:Spore gernimation protein n=1 Tax=Virgibacillus indicus TaxID=2024554 RepID=A0A265N8U1_9BACI|nr:GerAB/ArcD/ProY family transporter [Virgibacillus indicus]OZU87874.1 spore gernimation protein [Virgibacillus indicus]
MDINVKAGPKTEIRAFYLFFIISSLQLGVGIMGAPSIVFMESKQDSWISVLIAFLIIVFILFIMLYILKQYENTDIFGIQADVFGQWLGKLLGTVYIIYFLAVLFSVVTTYIDVVRVFIFPEVSPFLLALLLMSLVTYSVLGGFRVIVGVCFLFFILTHWILFLLIEPALEIDWTHLQPVMGASITELFKGAKATVYTLLGFEILFFVYPFIKNKEKVKLPVILAVGWTTVIILITVITSIGFFSPDQLMRREWPVLNLFKIQTFSFIERLDFVVVAGWMMVIVPNIVILMWGITYGMKRLYQIPQKKTLYIVSILLVIASAFMDNHFQIYSFTDIVARSGFWVGYIYPLLLLPLVLLKKRWRRKKGRGKGV